MIAAVDVHYRAETLAVAAAVVFNAFTDHTPVAQYSARTTDFGEYIPGKFYKRELPGIIAVLDKVVAPLDLAIIDGYVMLGDRRPGLGHHLWQCLGGQTAIIGVAKSPFTGANPVAILRGQSCRPLYITAHGIDPEIAAKRIFQMAGAYRIPDLIRQAHHLARVSL